MLYGLMTFTLQQPQPNFIKTVLSLPKSIFFNLKCAHTARFYSNDMSLATDKVIVPEGAKHHLR